MPLDYAVIDQCASRPALDARRAASMAKLRAAPYPDIPALSPGRSGNGTADLVVARPDATNGALKIRWTEGVARARAEVRGTFGKAAVAAETSAP
jgi:hypothetical protein